MSEISLPEGWVAAELSDLVHVHYGKALSSKTRSSQGSVLVVGSSGVVGKHDEALVSGPCLVVGRKGAAGSVHFVGQPSWPIDTAYFIQPPPDISLRYLYLFLGVQQLGQLDKSTAIPSLGRDDLYRVVVSLPPAAEQTRIVAKLEELLSDLDAGGAELKAAQKKLAQYRQSLLKAAVEDSGYGNTAYSKHPLGTLVTAIGQGWSPKCDREPAQEDDQWAVMKTTAIQPLEFDGAHNKALPVQLKPREHLELKPGDLLVTRAGPRNRVGITCLVKKTRSKLILCDKAYRIQCDQTRISPDFLELVLNAPHMLQKIDELKTGISDSGLNLTQDRFFSLEIPLPSLQKQLSIVEAVSTQFKLIQAQEKAIERSLQQSTAQRQNILRAAFCGQLVPQDPTDEPASVLLERIRTERAAQASAPKVRKARAVKETK